MFRAETYQEAYGFVPIEVLGGLAPLYQIPPVLAQRRPVLSTSPFVTHTLFPEVDLETWRRYVQRCEEIGRQKRARFVLVKVDRQAMAEGFVRPFELELRYNKRVLDLSEGQEAIWKRKLTDKVRNQVRKGQRGNPQVRTGREELLPDFYRVMAASQTQLGTPVHARRFFAAILRHNPDSQLMVVTLEKTPACAALLLRHGDTLYHPYAGTLQAFRHTSVNNLLYWRILCLGVELGCQTFDMGRSIRGSGNDHYKATWGGEERQIYYGYYAPDPRHVPRYDSLTLKVATSLWRNLPVPIAAGIGHHFIRRVP